MRERISSILNFAAAVHGHRTRGYSVHGREPRRAAPRATVVSSGVSARSDSRLQPGSGVWWPGWPMQRPAREPDIFFRETFAAWRTCGTCHPAQNNFTIDPRSSPRCAD